MVVHTKAAGRTTIKVTVRSESSTFGQFEGSVLELSDEIQILVSAHLNHISLGAADVLLGTAPICETKVSHALSLHSRRNPEWGLQGCPEGKVLAAKAWEPESDS